MWLTKMRNGLTDASLSDQLKVPTHTHIVCRKYLEILNFAENSEKTCSLIHKKGLFSSKLVFFSKTTPNMYCSTTYDAKCEMFKADFSFLASMFLQKILKKWISCAERMPLFAGLDFIPLAHIYRVTQA